MRHAITTETTISTRHHVELCRIINNSSSFNSINRLGGCKSSDLPRQNRKPENNCLQVHNVVWLQTTVFSPKEQPANVWRITTLLGISLDTTLVIFTTKTIPTRKTNKHQTFSYFYSGKHSRVCAEESVMRRRAALLACLRPCPHSWYTSSRG